jgi:rapamycin-insensitive companion of mTOR
MSARLQLLPDLLHAPSSANQYDQRLSSNVIYQIDSVNRTLHRSQGPSGPTNLAGDKAARKGPAAGSSTGGRPKLPIDMDEFQFRSLLIETQVVTNSNYLKWKWDLILDVAEGPLLNPKRVEDAIKGSKFLKRLMAFYRPFKYRFSEARNTKPNQRYVRTGQALMKALLKTQEGLQYLAGNKLLAQLTECLAQIDRVSLPKIFSFYKFYPYRHG